MKKNTFIVITGMAEEETFGSDIAEGKKPDDECLDDIDDKIYKKFFGNLEIDDEVFWGDEFDEEESDEDDDDEFDEDEDDEDFDDEDDFDDEVFDEDDFDDEDFDDEDFDEDEIVITLTDENGEETDFILLDVVEYQWNEYAVMIPLDLLDPFLQNDSYYPGVMPEELQGAADGKLLIMRIEVEEDGRESYSPVEDASVLEAILDIFRDEMMNDIDLF